MTIKLRRPSDAQGDKKALDSAVCTECTNAV